MKRLLLIVLIAACAVGIAPAQETLSVEALQGSFAAFADEAAAALPMNALVGLNWSDAYIGQLLAVPPNLGVGVTFGATSIPFDAVDKVFTELGIDSLGGDLEPLQKYGVPIPALAAEARVGGFILPFDVGLKFATVPQEAVPLLPEDVSLDYLSLGGDFRFALLKGNAVLPKVSVGASYNYLRGSVALGGILGGDIELTSFEAPSLADPQNTEDYTVSLEDPAVGFSWQTNVIEAKAQVSKKFLFLTPYAGVGLATGFSSVGGGLSSTVTVRDSGGTALSDAEVDELINALGEDAALAPDGFTVESADENAVAMRVYGGFSLNLLFFYLDATAMYNLNGGNWGGSLGARVQL